MPPALGGLQTACRMDHLAEARTKGVQSEFVDALGKLRVTAPDALTSILKALPEKRVYRFVSGAVVVRTGRQPRTDLTEAAKLPLRWSVANGTVLVAHGEAHERVIVWPD